MGIDPTPTWYHDQIHKIWVSSDGKWVVRFAAPGKFELIEVPVPGNKLLQPQVFDIYSKLAKAKWAAHLVTTRGF